MSSFFPLDPPAFEAPAKPSPAPARATVPARRLETDGRTLDYALDSKGRWQGGHPVDQGVTLSLMVRLGSIGSAPNVGNDLHETEIGVPSTANDVRDRVLRSYPLSRYIEEQAIEILDIRHEEIEFGGLKVSVTYRNLRTGQNERAFYRENMG